MQHIPVLINEMLDNLKPKDNEHYIDLTFGAGGYSKAILEKANCKVSAFDRDPYVIGIAAELKGKYKERFNFINSEFSKLKEFINDNSIDRIVGDFGVSSMQIDNADRGFSFLKTAKLDMRMSSKGVCAYDVVNDFSESDLANMIFNYGGERDSRKIARNILIERAKSPIEDTTILAEIIRKSKKFKYSKIDPATKTFQAIRIFVNNELKEIESLLTQISQVIKIDGRVIFISFHELEDRLIKNYLRSNEIKKLSTSKYKTEFSDHGIYKLLNKKAIHPSSEEIKNNPRSRSAVLRAAQKIRT